MQHRPSRVVLAHRDRVCVDPLEPRLVFDTGYFAAGIQYDDPGLSIFNEFGDYDEITGNIISGTREDSVAGSNGSPWAGFDFGGSAELFQSSLRFNGTDALERRVTVGFGETPLGFSVAYSGPFAFYRPPVQISFLLNQATDLSEGSGGRDGSFFFNEGTYNTANGDWGFNNGTSSISGLDVNGTRTGKSGDESFSLQLDPNAIFRDGSTLFADSPAVAFYGDNLGVSLQTDLDGSDGFQRYALGIKTEPGTSFTTDDFAGDVYALSLTGSPTLRTLIGGGASGSEPFTYTSALEFTDGNTFRMYDLLEYYTRERYRATHLFKGTYTIIGDEVRLTSFDGSRSIDLKFRSDLSLSLGVKYNVNDTDQFIFGGGPRILDGNPGDFIALNGDEDPAPDTFADATIVNGTDGTRYVITKAANGQETRFNLSEITGLNLSGAGLAAWAQTAGRSIGVFAVTSDAVRYIVRQTDGNWMATPITTTPAEILATTPSLALLPRGDITLGGFNADGDLLRFDFERDLWTVEVIETAPTPDSTPGTPTDNTSLLVTPWSGWHLFYIDSTQSLRAAWTTPMLNTYYDNNLSQRAGLPQVDGMAVHATVTDQAEIHVGLIDQGKLNTLSWNPSLDGRWNNSAFEETFGAGASGLSPSFVATHFDFRTGDLYIFAMPQSGEDIILFVKPAQGAWARHSVATDLQLADYTIPQPDTILITGHPAPFEGGFDLRGSFLGLGDLPILSRLFTTRPSQQQTQSLLIHLTPSLVEPTDDT